MYRESCIEKTNGEEVKSILDKLYTLRALFSKVSTEIEKMYSVDCKLDSSKKEMLEFLEFYNDFYTFYLSTFKDVIDEKNWENVDLIIYMLETNGTLTLKEAIQQIDLYRHTGKIVSTIDIATKTICNTIKYEPTKIENAIRNGINSINEKWRNSYFKNSVIKLELQNAMLEKYNATCEQMTQEIAQLKQFVFAQTEGACEALGLD